LKNFRQTLICIFQSNLDFKIIIAIMIVIENRFRINRTLIETWFEKTIFSLRSLGFHAPPLWHPPIAITPEQVIPASIAMRRGGGITSQPPSCERDRKEFYLTSSARQGNLRPAPSSPAGSS
jgi:hypothetical protein